jgi:hypothetical protein
METHAVILLGEQLVAKKEQRSAYSKAATSAMTTVADWDSPKELRWEVRKVVNSVSLTEDNSVLLLGRSTGFHSVDWWE